MSKRLLMVLAAMFAALFMVGESHMRPRFRERKATITSKGPPLATGSRASGVVTLSAAKATATNYAEAVAQT
jgi:hypothetical protein